MTRATRKPSGLPFRGRNDENYYKILQSRPLQVSGITTLVLSSPLSHVGDAGVYWGLLGIHPLHAWGTWSRELRRYSYFTRGARGLLKNKDTKQMGHPLHAWGRYPSTGGHYFNDPTPPSRVGHVISLVAQNCAAKAFNGDAQGKRSPCRSIPSWARVPVMAGPCFLAVDKKKNPAYGGRALMKYRAFSTMTTLVFCSFFAPFIKCDVFSWLH